MRVQVGMRLKSTVCDTEVIVVRPVEGDTDLRCGGEPMIGLEADAERGQGLLAEGPGTLLGKRYVDDRTGLELLCTKAGSGVLTVGTEILHVKATKPLPASD